MTAGLFDSPLHAALFIAGPAGQLFSDRAAIRAVLLVEGALAKAQGSAGIIPETGAAAIQRASREVAIDPAPLSAATGRKGVCVPALVEASRAAMNAPQHAQYIHWKATSQDILDTGLMLRLRQALALAETNLRALPERPSAQAKKHAVTVMSARTCGQPATPTSWGAVIAQWGWPLLASPEALPALRAQVLMVSLSGASGTAAALGPDVPVSRAAMAEDLGLTDPGRSWHADREPVLRIAEWMAEVTRVVGAMGQTLIALSGDQIGEVRIERGGASSTVPQKQNTAAASVLVSLAHLSTDLGAGLGPAATHRHQRDGAAWFTEWLVLPQIVLANAAALTTARDLMADLPSEQAYMRDRATGDLDLAMAETLSFALADTMPCPQAEAEVKHFCARALARQQTPLRDPARARFADLPASVFDSAAQLGHAPAEARCFASKVRAL